MSKFEPDSGSANGEDAPDPETAIIHEELNRRLELLDSLEDSEFGEFTTLDWTLCSVLFFFLPLLIAWWWL